MQRIIGVTAFFAITAALSPYIAAQQEPIGAPGFIEYVDGAENPELIRDDVVYDTVSSTLATTGPSNCVRSNTNEDRLVRGFSNQAPCMTLPGVDLALAEQLGMEFEAFVDDRNAALIENMCADPATTRLRNGSVADLAAYFDEQEREDRTAKVVFFENRGRELLGVEQFERLLDWANSNIRPNTRQAVVDFHAMLETTKVSPALMLEQSCSQSALQE